jgi:hypothetical protein
LQAEEASNIAPITRRALRRVITSFEAFYDERPANSDGESTNALNNEERVIEKLSMTFLFNANDVRRAVAQNSFRRS